MLARWRCYFRVLSARGVPRKELPLLPSSANGIMRLLSTETGHFVEINDPSKVEYAILSHTWDPAGEQSYREVREIQKALDMPVLQESAISDIILRSPSPELADADLYYDLPSPARHSPVVSDTFSLSTPSHWEVEAALSTPTPATPSMIDHPEISPKIKRACALARRYGHSFIWIDSCCIDKESSSELSEAINSMFCWYRDSSVCYAFLADVPVSDLETTEERTEMRFLVSVRKSFSLFRQSRWFTRGWTLQELVAPRVVIFVSQEWLFYGSKSALANVISEVTHIDCEVLTYRKQLHDLSVFHRMTWASRRTTTRVEDQAYSLLGIFNIHMPILYGEGHRAFVRLQHAILMEIPDESLIIWNTLGSRGSRSILRLPSPCFSYPAPGVRHARPQFTFQHERIQPLERGLLADRPADFSLCPRRISALSHTQFARRLGLLDVSLPKYSPTPYGVNARFPFLPASQVLSQRSIIGSFEDCYLALLACEDTSESGSLVAMLCVLENIQAGRRLMQRSSLCVRGCSPQGMEIPDFLITYIVLSPGQIERLDRTNLRVYKVRVPNCAFPDLSSTLSHTPQHTESLLPRLSTWNLEILREAGYAVRSLCDDSCGNLRIIRLLRGSVGVQLRFEVMAGFICSVNVWVSPFYQRSATIRETLPDASPIPTFRFQVRDIRQEQSVQVVWPNTSGNEKTTIRVTLYYVTSSNSCSLTVEALRSGQDPCSSDATSSTIPPPTPPSISLSEYLMPAPPGCSHELQSRSSGGGLVRLNGTKNIMRWQESSNAREDEGSHGESGRSQKRRRLLP
ncbi:HET-domain-containing protein [Lentinus brumalis]|uniref:HET-domain-containing protein n=1 Tax=Lentinus brumalis TaxID=2498619 RepID=A0A371CZA5_9APHY|nr:HET-domain-containing protein [Polyporus brumalis]